MKSGLGSARDCSSKGKSTRSPSALFLDPARYAGALAPGPVSSKRLAVPGSAPAAASPSKAIRREKNSPQSYGTLSHLCASEVIESARARCGA